MKKISQFTGLLFSCSILLVMPRCFAQIDEIGNMMASGAEDAKLLLNPISHLLLMHLVLHWAVDGTIRLNPINWVDLTSLLPPILQLFPKNTKHF